MPDVPPDLGKWVKMLEHVAEHYERWRFLTAQDAHALRSNAAFVQTDREAVLALRMVGFDHVQIAEACRDAGIDPPAWLNVDVQPDLGDP